MNKTSGPSIRSFRSQWPTNVSLCFTGLFAHKRRYLTAVLLMLLTASAWAGTWNAFGPQTYQQTTTTPKAVSSTFTVLNTATTYTLVVTGTTNANPLITINGKTVINQTNPNVSKTVTLTASNTIAVTVRGGVGSSVTATITGVDNDLPTITAAASPAKNAAGWNNTNVTVTFTCADKTSGVASCTAPVVVSTDGASQVVKGTATDKAGNTASTSVTINLDKTLPTISPSQTPAADSFGWNNAAVTVSFACTDVTSGVSTCTGPTTLSVEGANQAVKGTATDKAGNSATATDTVNIDKTAPTISSSATPAANAAGWNNSNVTVAYTCTDALSGIATCPATATVSTEGLNQAISGTATDKAGNTASNSRTVSLDKTPPTITAALAPAANAAGWNNANVTATFTCSDALSGVASCPAAATVSTEGANQTVPGTATDKAGNSAASATKVSIDKTAPVITPTLSPLANSFGWNNTSVTVSFGCSDALSGVASCAAPLTLTREGSGQIATGNATDIAGNTGSGSATVNIDETAPTISAVLTPLPNSAGWNNTNVSASFTCTDSLSGVATCPAATTVTTEGANQTLPGAATDKAGNSAAPATKVSIDKTAPVVTPTLSPLANSFGWNNTSVTVSFGCSDVLSGVASCAAPLTLTREGSGQIATGNATDIAGNTGSGSATVNIDETAPTISVALTPLPNSAGWNNTNVSASFTCADSLSGVATCPAATTVTTEGANQSLPGTASDKAGNSASPATKVSIDKTPPVITPTLSPLANSFGWNNTSVTVSFGCSDALSGVASCAAPVLFSREGAGQTANGTATDIAGNSASASATVNIDETAPAITAAISPAPNAAGWNNSNVTVSFTCADAGSGIATCPPVQTVTTEGASQNVTGTATDKAGNTASAAAIVNIDRTPPTITPAISPVPNAAGWNNTNVTISFTCTDAGSGVAVCPAPIQVTTEGANQVFTATAVDIAGNSTPVSVTLNIDKTPAIITASASPLPNANGWNTSPVTITFQCSDALSGVVACPAPQTVSTQGANQIISGTVLDVAGNSSSASVTINLETGQPAITASGAPPANAAGWNNTDVTVAFHCTAAAAPITSCPQQQIVTTEGANQAFSGTVADAAGNSASTSITLNIDKTPPIISASVLPAPNANGIIFGQSATVSFTCSDTLSGIFTCPSPLTITTTGLQTLSGSAVDVAGNTASASVQFNLQNFPPLQVVASVAPTPNAAGWNNTPVTVSFLCTGGAPPVSCPAPQTVSIDGNNQVVTGTATDALGTSVSASATVNLDQTAPLVTITAPADGSISPSANVSVAGLTSDGLSGLATVTCNDTPATITGGSFTCSLQITQGSLAISVQATDVAGNSATASLNTNLQGPKLTISAPAPQDLFGANPVTVTGTVDDPAAIISVNGIPATNSGSTFKAEGIILREGNNLITATGTNTGGAAGTASVNVVLDTTPPTISIDSPTDKAIVTSPQIEVTGLVNDVVTGTVNAAQVSVIINGVQAEVANRGFMAENVLLVPGQNVITAVAKDRAGNISQSQVTVTLRDVGTQQRILMVSGNDQTGSVGSTLPQPLTVQVVNAIGQSVANVPVTFTVEKSDGQLSAFPQQGRQLTIQTDANGQAAVTAQLGTRVGPGNNHVSVTSPGFVGEVMFCASTTVGAPSQIHDISGGSQIGVIGQPLPESLVVGVFDAIANPVAGVPVIFKVEQGGGTFDGTNTTITVTTDADGRATTGLTLAQEEGVNNNVVSATFAGLTGAPSIFTASGKTPSNPANTRVTGIVLDNANQPVPNATASIQGTNLTAFTDATGHFTISNAPIGSIVLFVDGSTSTRSDSFPFLEFPMVTVSGQDNNLGRPIFLPALDVDNSKIVGGDEDVTLTLKGVPGVAYTVFAHSATFPDGSKVGRLTLSQVHADKVPMIPPNGTAPTLVGTLQPSRVKFNPPIRVQLPNTDAMAPGQVAELFSFHHDLEQFVSEGTMRVSPDGSVLVTDPGFGLTVSGWHGGGGPPPPPTCADGCKATNDCNTASCEKGVCVQHPANEGGQCGGGNEVCGVGKCEKGACVSANDGKECTPEDKCQQDPGKCEGAKCVGKPVDLGEEKKSSIGVDVKFPEELVSSLNDFLHLIPGLGGVNFEEGSITPEVTTKDCCNDKTGIQKDGEKAGSAEVTLSARIRDVPLLGLGVAERFDLPHFPGVRGFVSIVAGVAFTSDLQFDAKAGHRFNACENIDCFFGSMDVGLAPGLELTIKSTDCIAINGFIFNITDCERAEVTPAAVEASVKIGGRIHMPECKDGLQGFISMGNVKFKADVKIPGLPDFAITFSPPGFQGITCSLPGGCHPN